MKDDKELQTKYIQFQLLEQQMKELHNQIEALENQIMEAKIVQQSVDEFKNAKAGSEVLVPLSSGIFAKAELKDNRELLVNVGANVVVKKTVEDTKELMERQVGEIKKVRRQMLENMQKFDEQLVKLEEELNRLMEGSSKQARK